MNGRCSKKKEIVKEAFIKGLLETLDGTYVNHNQTFPFQFEGNIFDVRIEITDSRDNCGRVQKDITELIVQK